MPDRINAGHHGTYGLHVFFGQNPRTGQLFQHIESGIGGWGASSRADGACPYRSLVHGDMLDTPAELFEAFYPLRMMQAEMRPDSGGAGKFRGGLGTIKQFEVVSACTMSVYFERTKCRPWGLKGGKSGEHGYVDVCRAGVPPQRLLKGEAELQPGDRVFIVTGGGGGFGLPYERDVQRVRDDVLDEYISVQAAAGEYGVVLDDDLNIVERRQRPCVANCGPKSLLLSSYKNGRK